MRRLLGVLLGLGALAAAFFAGAATDRSSRRPDVVSQARADIAKDAVAPVNGDTLDAAEIQAMLAATGDRWAAWHPSDEASEATAPVDGRYSGIGVWLAPVGVRVEIASVVPASPAADAGLVSGDDLLSVDGRTLDPGDLTSALASLRGPANTSTNLVISRSGVVSRLVLRREDVATATDVHTDMPAPGVLRLAVSTFSRGSADALAAAVAADPGARGIVLDLRGNPGGLLGEAVSVAGEFLDGGPVVTYVRRASAPVTLLADTGRAVSTPMVVLVDASTASAAEVLAGALADRGRAVVVGQKTFGKASVQETVTLTDGSTLELTVARYQTPNGRDLDGVGLTPDVVTGPSSGSDDPTLVKSLDVLGGLMVEAGSP